MTFMFYRLSARGYRDHIYDIYVLPTNTVRHLFRTVGHCSVLSGIVPLVPVWFPYGSCMLSVSSRMLSVSPRMLSVCYPYVIR